MRDRAELGDAAARSTAVGEQISDGVAWIRSYVLEEREGRVCRQEGLDEWPLLEPATRSTPDGTVHGGRRTRGKVSGASAQLAAVRDYRPGSRSYESESLERRGSFEKSYRRLTGRDEQELPPEGSPLDELAGAVLDLPLVACDENDPSEEDGLGRTGHPGSLATVVRCRFSGSEITMLAQEPPAEPIKAGRVLTVVGTPTLPLRYSTTAAAGPG